MITDTLVLEHEVPIHDEHCPNCGRYVSYDKGWYQKENIADDSSDVLLFCNQKCADLFAA